MMDLPPGEFTPFTIDRWLRPQHPHGMKITLGILSLTIATLLTAADWPEFRGPTGQGHADANLPIEFGEGKNLKWKAPVPGDGWSSPAIVKGRIYLTSALAKENELKLIAICLDAANGIILWQKQIVLVDGKPPRAHRKNSQASPTPIVADDRLYVHFGHMGTACLDLDGKIIWSNTAIKYPPVHGNGGSPVLTDGKLIFSCDGASSPFVIALNAKDGTQAWKVNRSVNARRKFSFSTPLVINTSSGKQVILPGSDMVGAYNPANGDEIWRATYDGYSVVPRPVIAHGMVFFSSGFDRATAMAVKLGGKGDVTESHVAWVGRKGAPHTPSMIATGNELYMVSDGGIASCLDAKTGKAHWSERLGGGHSASPILANGRIYFVSEPGVVNVVAADKEYKLLASNKLGERSLASPAVADGALFVRTSNHLWRFEKQEN